MEEGVSPKKAKCRNWTFDICQKTVGEMCVYGEAYINKRGQIKSKKMYWISRTKFLLIFKCTGNPEYEMCLYGEGILRIKEC